MNGSLITIVVAAVTLLFCTVCLDSCQAAWINNVNANNNQDFTSLLLITGYSKVRMQNQIVATRGPVVGSEKARELLLHPELATEPPEPISIFVRPMKNLKTVNFPDEIKPVKH